MANDLLSTNFPDTRSRDDPGPTQAVVEAVVPLLRGWLHLICFVASLPAGILVVASAPSPKARVAATVYALGVTALFGVSAAYHRRQWSVIGRARMKRVDHATIFVMIAASYTPLCVLALGGALGSGILFAAWAGAGVGVVLATTGVAEKPVVGLAIYIGFGWMMSLALPELGRQVGGALLVTLLVGGLLYTVGGIVLGARWPDLFPAVFGYHELWHLMVAAAAACHYVAILAVVKNGV